MPTKKIALSACSPKTDNMPSADSGLYADKYILKLQIDIETINTLIGKYFIIKIEHMS